MRRFFPLFSTTAHGVIIVAVLVAEILPSGLSRSRIVRSPSNRRAWARSMDR